MQWLVMPQSTRYVNKDWRVSLENVLDKLFWFIELAPGHQSSGRYFRAVSSTMVMTGWPDWPDFRLLRDCLIEQFFWRKNYENAQILLQKKFGINLCKQSIKIGQHFGLFFHKIIKSHWPRPRELCRRIRVPWTKSEIPS
jgi:hypothetical protein